MAFRISIQSIYTSLMKRNWHKWLVVLYVFGMALVMLGYVYYDPYQIDGDAVSYMDLASDMLRGRWHEVVNGLWNPGYPAILALGKFLIHSDRMHEIQTFYWVNYFLFLFSVFCTALFVQSVIHLRTIETSQMPDSSEWMLSNGMLHIVSYAVVLISWEHEFSPGKIRVDGLFASFLLLGFGSLLRIVNSSSKVPAICAGAFLGLAYLVKSPGLNLAILTFFLFAGYFYFESKLRAKSGQMLLAIAFFIAVVSPYITALSLQKGRFDAGDSARLNYAWLVSGTEPLHLLNDEPDRFGHAVVRLKHPQVELLSHPGVVSFAHFRNTTYPPWFDPSYFNEGVHPRFSLKLQILLLLNQMRKLFLFLLSHALVLAFLLVSIVCGAKIVQGRSPRRILSVLYLFLLFSFTMYLLVHFLDRYVAGMFWLASIATLGLLTISSSAMKQTIKGAAIFLSLAILLLGIQNVVQMRRAAIFDGVRRGWQRTDQFNVAKKLREAGVAPGTSIACFQACDTGAYWARLAGIHVVSEIFDPRYRPEMGNGTLLWQQLPNRTRVIEALESSGAEGLVGYFDQPPTVGERWQPLAGQYYWMPFAEVKPFSTLIDMQWSSMAR